jgi:hypothetical protein
MIIFGFFLGHKHRIIFFAPAMAHGRVSTVPANQVIGIDEFNPRPVTGTSIQQTFGKGSLIIWDAVGMVLDAVLYLVLKELEALVHLSVWIFKRTEVGPI